ncbi:MAG: PucR family transcriptional regulator [Pseudomonadota bacterium]
MPVAITRFFNDPAELEAISKELVYKKRLPKHSVRAFRNAETLVASLTDEGVATETAEAYRALMEKGGEVLLVIADYKPLGVARITRERLAASGAADLGDIPEEATLAYMKVRRRSLLSGNPLLLSRERDPESTTYHMANWPFPLLTEKLEGPEPIIPPHGRMASWPIGLLLPGSVRYGRFPFGLLVPGNKFMAKFPFAHIVPGHKFMAKFPFAHLVPGHRFMAKFPFAHLVPGHKFMAKFPFDHIVPGHLRMANWPFPLLINGQTHTNSLVPDQQYMAKFPFAHIVPGHKFMAKFPFAHLVPGHKFMAKFPFAHLVPGHKYMANWIFPHSKPKGA